MTSKNVAASLRSFDAIIPDERIQNENRAIVICGTSGTSLTPNGDTIFWPGLWLIHICGYQEGTTTIFGASLRSTNDINSTTNIIGTPYNTYALGNYPDGRFFLSATFIVPLGGPGSTPLSTYSVYGFISGRAAVSLTGYRIRKWRLENGVYV